MPFRPLDELDDLEDIGLSRLLPLRRICSSKACRGTARHGGRHCLACHARAVQRYRDRHAKELATRRRDADALRDDRTRAADSARAKLAMALRRGTMQRGLCQICGTADVIGIIKIRSGGGTLLGSAGAIEMRLESGSVTDKPRLLAPVNKQLGPMNGRRFLPRLSFFRRMSGRSSTRSLPKALRAGRCRPKLRYT